MILICISLVTSNVEHLFIYLLYVFSGKMSVQGFCPLFTLNWFSLLSCMSSSYVLGVNSLPHMWLTNVFSHPVGCLFHLRIVSVSVQKRFSLMQPHLFIFAFAACAFTVFSEKSGPRPMPRLPPYVLLWEMMVSGLRFKSLIHFEFIFVSGVR